MVMKMLAYVYYEARKPSMENFIMGGGTEVCGFAVRGDFLSGSSFFFPNFRTVFTEISSDVSVPETL